MSDAKVELIDIALNGCKSNALNLIPSSTSESTCTLVATRCEFANNTWGVVVAGSLSAATFKNCVFHNNQYGLIGSESTIHLHGEATAIHSNGRHGIYAFCYCKVIIHLPSHHNTTYNNGEDRRTSSGGTITNVED